MRRHNRRFSRQFNSETTNTIKSEKNNILNTIGMRRHSRRGSLERPGAAGQGPGGGIPDAGSLPLSPQNNPASKFVWAPSPTATAQVARWVAVAVVASLTIAIRQWPQVAIAHQVSACAVARWLCGGEVGGSGGELDHRCRVAR